MSWKPCLKEKKQLTSDVSHELRTPISISAQCGQLLKDEALKAKAKSTGETDRTESGKYVRSDRAASVFIKSRSGASADRERKR